MSHFGYRAVYVLRRMRRRNEGDVMVIGIQREKENTFMRASLVMDVKHSLVLRLIQRRMAGNRTSPAGIPAIPVL